MSSTPGPARVRGRAIGIIGMARSGLAVALLAQRHGGRPFVSDAAGLSSLADPIDRLAAAGIPYEHGGHGDRLLDSDFLVVSPGVPSDLPILDRARALGLPVYGELEVASWFCRAPIAAITGSNGKTTTTSLLGAMLAAAGRAVEVCGNIGRPFAAVAELVPEHGVAAVEVSSFQLETIDTFRPHVAVILNLQADHLDRHGTLAAYRRAKHRIAANQGPGDWLVVNHDDPAIQAATIRTSAARVAFSIGPPGDAATFVTSGCLHVDAGAGPQALIDVAALRLPGRHNLANAAAAALVAALLGTPTAVLGEVLRDFRGVEHRLETVDTVRGVTFINDSKATNVDATCVALASLDRPVHLILGGRDKGAPYTPIARAGGGRLRSLVVLGEARPKILADLGDAFPTRVAATLDEAVALCFAAAAPGEIVLLSPACASFDMFHDYEHRGRVFKAAVARLGEATAADAISHTSHT